MAFKELLFSLIVAAVLQCIVAQPRPPALTSAVSNMLNQPRVPSLQQQNMMKLVSLLGRKLQQQRQQRNPLDFWLNMQLMTGELEGPMRLYALSNLMRGMGGGAGGAGGAGGGAPMMG